MKFMLQINPVVPASAQERERLRPIAHRTDKIQQIIPDVIEPDIETGTAFVGTVDDIRRQISGVQGKMDPQYFLWLCDQRYLPFYEVEKQLELFGAEVMREFMG